MIMKNKLLHLIVFWTCTLQAQEVISPVSPEEIVASTKENISAFDRTVNKFSDNQDHLAQELIIIFNDTNSSNLSQCEAAHFLGELKISKAADSLSKKITLRLDASHLIITHLPSITVTPAVDALIKIGNPSIPAVIRNLVESDDAKVRELSLKVLYRIEGDKDIVQLRLQKALKAETDTQKQVRLQSALKALAETSFAN